MNKNWLEEIMKPEHRGTWLSLIIAVTGGYFLFRSSDGQEISWQEFRTRYLETGEVRER